MKKKLLSLALSGGLMVGTFGTASAQGAPATCASFINEMEQTWSMRGYSSLSHAVNIEGGDWFSRTCQGAPGAFDPVTGTYNVPNNPMRGQPAHAGNLVEQNGRAFGGTFGAGQLEDDEANGSVTGGNSTQGGHAEW